MALHGNHVAYVVYRACLFACWNVDSARLSLRRASLSRSATRSPPGLARRSTGGGGRRRARSPLRARRRLGRIWTEMAGLPFLTKPH